MTVSPSAPPAPQLPISLLIVGCTGVGKSAFCNAVMGARVFEDSNSAHSHTTAPRAEFSVEQNCEVIDTPGLQDAGGSGMDAQNMRKIIQFVHDKKQVTAIALVFNYTAQRCDHGMQLAVHELVNAFGEAFFEHLCFVFTKVASLNHAKVQSDICTKSIEYAGLFAKQCGLRCVPAIRCFQFDAKPEATAEDNEWSTEQLERKKQMNADNMRLLMTWSTTKKPFVTASLDPNMKSREEKAQREAEEKIKQAQADKEAAERSMREAQAVTKKLQDEADRRAAELKRMASVSKFVRYWNGKEHFYTTNVHEIGTDVPQIRGRHGYTCELTQCRVLAAAENGAVPFYRYWKENDHFYTTNVHEIGTDVADVVGHHGYKCEGVAAYVWTEPGEGRVPLYRYWNDMEHFYTTNVDEIGTTTPGVKGKHNYKSEGIAAYVLP